MVLALTVALMSGGLLQERQPPPQFHLVDSSTLEVVAGGLLKAGAGDNVEVMSLAELQAEKMSLEDSKRSLVLPIVLIGVGVAAYVTGAIIYAATLSLAGAAIELVLYLAATALVVVGAILLIVAIVHNVKIGKRMRRVDERISTFNSPGMPAGGGSNDAPPPPPPPPPGAQWLMPVQPTLTLASF